MESSKEPKFGVQHVVKQKKPLEHSTEHSNGKRRKQPAPFKRQVRDQGKKIQTHIK